ncbi:MAG TPA: hypothetical protein VL947_06120 [Cytophagales bacterium]|nr:hypothetical protein [Cytophagales bacterium]
MVKVNGKNLVITVCGDEETASEFKKAMFTVLKSADNSQINNDTLYFYLELLESLS